MTLIVEDGTGVFGANSYTTVEFITSYLSDRNRKEENSWSSVGLTVQKAAAIAGTDFIEQRFRLSFLGKKEFLDVSAGRSTLTLTGQPLDAETVTIGATVYTFNTVLGGAYSVLIGSSVEESIDNLISAISASASGVGSLYGSGTAIHPDVSSCAGIKDTMVAYAKEKGTAGNGIQTTKTLTNGSWSSATLVGGGDFPTPQSLSFPRLYLFDRDGIAVRGIPMPLKFANAEYAVRSLSAALMPDPIYHESGRTTTEESTKIGPIEEKFKFSESGALTGLVHAYPAADRLLSEYKQSGGRVIRG